MLRTILNHTLGRWTRRARARRELEQIRADISKCAAIFLTSTQGGTVPQVQLPTESRAYLASLHADGVLSDEGLSIIRDFFEPAEQANSWLLAPPQHGPPGINGAQRLASLFRGRHHVESLDGNGNTLLDQALAQVATALTTLERRRWRSMVTP